ncbi:MULTISPECIES: hypothetical protein [unclassified Mesorhizobium]|uniref:hypothetical protein n=1 Tax=unclassified Mesorhizobium TaxID=325217 RepID=UPI00142EC318|nr:MULTISPECIES: hypothetical protein [unclassified Mesorhizobium]
MDDEATAERRQRGVYLLEIFDDPGAWRDLAHKGNGVSGHDPASSWLKPIGRLPGIIVQNPGSPVDYLGGYSDKAAPGLADEPSRQPGGRLVLPSNRNVAEKPRISGISW